MVKIIILILLVISNGSAKDGPSFEITKITATSEEIIIYGAQLENIEGVSLRSLNKDILKKYQVNTATGNKVIAQTLDERPLPSNENLYLVVRKLDEEVSYPIAITSQGDKKVIYKISRKKKIKSPKNIELDEKSVINFYPSQDYTGYDYDYTMLTNSFGDLVIKGFDKTLFKIDQFGNLEISGTLKVKGKAVEDFIVPYEAPKSNLRISNVVIGEDNSISGVTTFSSSGNMDVATGTFHVDSATGRVGIGISTPTYKLDILGADNSGIRLRQPVAATNTDTAFFNGMVFEGPVANRLFGIGYGVGELFSINSFDGSNYRNIFSLNNVGNGVIAGSLKIGAYTLPAADGATGTILRTNGAGVVSWTTAGNGDVVGPATSVANTLPVFSDTTGKLLSNGKPLYVDLTTGAGDPSYLEGRLFFDDVAKTAAIYTDVNGVKINLGQALTFKVRNNSGASILKGSVVRTTGTVGNRPAIALAQANTLANSGVIGVTAQDIVNNADGFVTSFGSVRNLDTNAFPNGTILYLSSTVPGGLTATPPPITVRIGRVLNQQNTQGILGVSIFSNNPGTVTNSTGSATNTVALFSDASGTVVKNTPYTIPTINGTNGQVLTTDGAGVTSWTNAGSGDVAGPATSAVDNLASFSGGTGKAIKDSGIASANIPTMATGSTKFNQIIISAGAFGKQLTTTVYPIPETIGASGTVLKSDGTNAFWQPDDIGASLLLGAVTGPLTHFNHTLPLWDGINTNKLLETLYTFPLSAGSPGQTLITDGVGTVNWGSVQTQVVNWQASTAYKQYDLVVNNQGLIRAKQDYTSSSNAVDDVFANLAEWISPSPLATGVLEGGVVTLGAGSTVNVTGGRGVISDYSSTLIPKFSYVNWSGGSNISLSDPTGYNTVYINSAGQIGSVGGIQSFSFGDANIILAYVNPPVGEVASARTYTTDPVSQVKEFSTFLGMPKKGMNYAGKSDRTFERSSGSVYSWGSNWGSDDKSTLDFAATSTVNFYYATRSTVGGTSGTIIDPDNYNPSGATISAISASNPYTYQRIYQSITGKVALLYGQSTFNTQGEAINAIDAEAENIFVPSTLANSFRWVGTVVLQKGIYQSFAYLWKNCGYFGCGDAGVAGSGGGNGDVFGPPTAATNSFAIFADSSGKNLIQASFSPPSSSGALGEALISNGNGTTKWGPVNQINPARVSLPSDKKLKKEIKNLPEKYVLRLMDLRPVSFIWKDTLNPDIGFIAQEVKKIFPEFVEEDAGYIGVNYQKLVVPLVKAVQEQQKEIKKYQDIIFKLEARIEKLEQKSSN